MNKKGVFPYIAILVVLSIGAVALLAVTGNLNIGAITETSASSLDYDNVYVLNWGSMCCQAGSYKTLDGPKYADDKITTQCKENVDTCDLIIECAGPFPALAIGYCKVEYNECDIGGSNCVKRTYTIGKYDIKQFPLQAGKEATFLKNSALADDRKYYTWERKGAIYRLKITENGKIVLDDSCTLSDSLKGKVLAGIPNQIPRGNCEDDGPINYFLGYSQSYTKTYKYKTQEVVCQTRTVYGIDTQTFKDGSVVRIMGNKIADVECCPSESNCGTDFKFKVDAVKECTYNYECDNGGDLFGITQTTAGYFVCQGGECVKKTKQVECTSDSVCQTRYGGGYICSKAQETWGECIEAPSGPYCGDGYCDIGESKSTCAEDCELECLENEKLVSKEKKVDCIVGFPVYWGCSTEVSKECKAEGVNWVLWILLGLVFILLLTQWRKILMFFKIIFHI